jgi:outer membrane immunogenic protein
MKTLLASVVGLGAVAAMPATAADMPLKAPPPVVVYNWTGFYVGGNVGYSWGSARTDIAGSATSVTFPGGPAAVTNPPATFADSQSQRLNGVIGGGQIGYNYQVSPKWVLGF